MPFKHHHFIPLTDYFPLGDITSIGSIKPRSNSDAMMVRDNKDGLVAPPDYLV